MKRIISLMLTLSIFVCTNLVADFQAANDLNEAVTVDEAKGLEKETDVILTGNIIKKIGEQSYIFKDGTGKINLKISNKNLKGIKITPDTKVTIYGEVSVFMRSGIGRSICVEVNKVQVDKTIPALKK